MKCRSGGSSISRVGGFCWGELGYPIRMGAADPRPWHSGTRKTVAALPPRWCKHKTGAWSDLTATPKGPS